MYPTNERLYDPLNVVSCLFNNILENEDNFFLSRSKKKVSSFSKHYVKTKENEGVECKPGVSHGNRF